MLGDCLAIRQFCFLLLWKSPVNRLKTISKTYITLLERKSHLITYNRSRLCCRIYRLRWNIKYLSMFISSFALCRVKFLLSLTEVVVSLQFLVFVADQVWFQDDVVKDCTTEKIAGIVKDLCASMR